ncbi:hypothetical protein HOY80DRAFT_990151, partial [Tuber brumale]
MWKVPTALIGATISIKRPSTAAVPPPPGGSSVEERQYEDEVMFENLQAGWKSPLYSVKIFEDLGL